MKYVLILAFCMFSSCANNRFAINKIKKFSDPLKISEMFTRQWVRVKLRKNPGCLNKYLYSKGTLAENRKTVIMTQMSSGFDILKFQCYYERNGIQFGKTVKYLYLHELPEAADKALAKDQNVIILTAEEVSEINKFITHEFETNNTSEIVMNHMSAFKLRQGKF